MHWLGRYFARVMVRRVAYVLVAALLTWIGLSDGRAQTIDYTQCFSGSNFDSAERCGDQGEAAAGLMSAAALGKAKLDANPNRTQPVVIGTMFAMGCDASWCTIGVYLDEVSGSHTARMTRSYPVANTCTARNANALADAKLWPTQPASCIAGCAVQGTAISQQQGGVTLYGMTGRSYTGGMCSPQKIDANAEVDAKAEKDESTKPKPQECTALGSGQTGCLKSNGDYCATASTGKTFCWTPQETGSKTDGESAQVKGKKGDAVTPPNVAIDGKEWQRTEGHQVTACVNNTCTTYNVTNFTGVAAGTAKNSSGDNSSDGSGNTSGNGTPGKGSSDSGGDDDDGDSASDSGNCTTPPMCTGDTLKCLHLKFTWKNQCNTTHNEVSKGDSCDPGDVPVCAGSSCKAEAYSQLLQQWRARCDGEAIRKGVEGEAGQGDGDDGKGSILIGEGGTGASLNEGLLSYGAGSLGYDFDVEGVKFKMPQQVLDFLPILRVLIIAAASLAAIAIMRGS